MARRLGQEVILSQAKHFTIGTIQIVVIAALAFFVWRGWDTVEDYWNRIQSYPALEQANIELAQDLEKVKNDKRELREQYETALEGMHELSLAYAAMQEENANAKQELRKKDIIGNSSDWLKNNPSGFRESTTNASNGVLLGIGKLSERDKSPSDSGSAKENTLPDSSNPQDSS